MKGNNVDEAEGASALSSLLLSLALLLMLLAWFSLASTGYHYTVHSSLLNSVALFHAALSRNLSNLKIVPVIFLRSRRPSLTRILALRLSVFPPND